MIMAVVVALSAFFATAALAANQIIRCAGIPCVSTGKSDLVYERKGNGLNDRILLRAGNDQVRANGYTRDRDVIRGGSGFLFLTGEGHADFFACAGAAPDGYGAIPLEDHAAAEDGGQRDVSEGGGGGEGEEQGGEFHGGGRYVLGPARGKVNVRRVGGRVTPRAPG